MHGAHTSGRRRLCAAYRDEARRCGARRVRRRPKETSVATTVSDFGYAAKSARSADRGVRGQRRGGGDGTGSDGGLGVPGASTRARGEAREALRPRRGSSASGGGPGERPEGNGHVRHLVFPGKMFERPRSRGGAETDLAAWTRRVAARARRRTRRGAATARLGRGAFAVCAAAPRRVEYEALAASARARLRKSRARFHQSRTGRTLWVFFFFSDEKYVEASLL